MKGDGSFCRTFMKKIELIKAVAEQTGITQKQAGEVVNATLDVIVNSLAKHEEVSLLGFGTFSTPYKEEHEARNPATGEKMVIKGNYAVKFKVSSTVKAKVNE